MADQASTLKRDYRETIFLPETPFPMRAGLPALEVRLLASWTNLYHENSGRSTGSERSAFCNS